MIQNKSRFASFFKSRNDSTFSANTVLTYDTWNDYLYSSVKTKDSQIWKESRIGREFSFIESCAEITNNFFAIPEQSRQSIIRLIGLRFSHAEIISFTNIFHKLNQLYPRIESSRLLFTHDSYQGRRGYKPKFSNEFVDKTYEFVNFQKSASNNIIWHSGRVSGSPIYILLPIYGERKIIDAIDLWIANDGPIDRLDLFFTLLDRLDDVDDNYPLSWTLGLLTSDICTKLQMVSK